MHDIFFSDSILRGLGQKYTKKLDQNLKKSFLELGGLNDFFKVSD